MDTEAFLVARRDLVGRLRGRRAASLDEKRQQKSGWRGLPWGQWARFALGLEPTQRGLGRLGGLVVTSLLPFSIEFLRRKVVSRLSRKSPWQRLANLVSHFML